MTEVYAVVDALVRPDAKNQGFLDTAIVTLRFDNGAVATAEANFSATYGYDIRGEVFGSRGMVTMGDVRRSSLALWDESGQSSLTTRQNTHLFHDAYTSELAEFVRAVRAGGAAKRSRCPCCAGDCAGLHPFGSRKPSGGAFQHQADGEQFT